RQKSRPLHTKSFLPRDFFREIIFSQLYIRFGTACKWSYRCTWNRSSHACVVIGLEPRFTVRSGQKSIGHSASIRTKELSSGNKGNCSVGKFSVKAIENRNDMSRLAGIVSNERPRLVGKRPDHGDFPDPGL